MRDGEMRCDEVWRLLQVLVMPCHHLSTLSFCHHRSGPSYMSFWTLLQVWTLLHLVRPGTVVYNVFVDRPFSFMFFAKIDEIAGKPFKVPQHSTHPPPATLNP